MLLTSYTKNKVMYNEMIIKRAIFFTQVQKLNCIYFRVATRSEKVRKLRKSRKNKTNNRNSKVNFFFLKTVRKFD